MRAGDSQALGRESVEDYVTDGELAAGLAGAASGRYAAFGVGEDNLHISTVDADGVALVAIKGLYRTLNNQNAEIKRQHEMMTQLQTENERLESKLETIETKLAEWIGEEGP